MKISKLKPIETLTQVDKIEQSLQDYLESANLQPGDALPKEVELAQALGVSRTAIREALSRFRTLGIIESRKNRGMLIASPDPLVNFERVMSPKLLNDDTLKDMFELRLVLEVGNCELVFKRKTAADIEYLESIVDKEEHTPQTPKNSPVLIKYDIDFHSGLYKISGNDTLIRFQKMLMPVFMYSFKKFHPDPKQSILNHEVSHRDLLNTLKKGTVDDFRSKMKKHLRSYYDKIS
ncbi:FCD domain-containing protein [Niabella sp.]|uniref:FadR/GntR family transcriptional regulator n=1 Tax=Niabella sp. TaxID=1962976 RepID=UPI0026388935|nr:FCD domain-containing protein [Niabella sp.]